jgi:hypothetical protein
VAALQAAAAGGDVDVDSLRNVLGEPMAWKSAEEKLQEYYTLKATGKVVPAAFARANPQLVNAHEDGGAAAKGKCPPPPRPLPRRLRAAPLKSSTRML